MIWPWSKIRTLEDTVERQRMELCRVEQFLDGYRERAEQMDRALAAERERCDRLMAQIVELRREGFNPAPAPATPPATEDLPPEVRSAIRERAGKDARLAAELYEQAQADLARSMKPEEVAQGILKGGDYDPWGE